MKEQWRSMVLVYGQKLCKVLKYMFICSVWWQHSFLENKQIYSSNKARQEWLMHSAWDTPQHQPVMRIWKKLGVWGQCGTTHMPSHLFALFSPPFHLTALLPLVSDLHTKLVCDYFSVLLQSNSLSLTSVSAPRFSNQPPLPITAKHCLAPSFSV